MIVRSELKEKAKAAFKANYWKCVLVAFIFSLVVGGTTAASGNTTVENANNATNTEGVAELNQAIQQDPQVLAIILGILFTIILIVVVVSTVVDVFITNPLQMGCMSFFLKNADDPNTGVDEIKRGFTPNYKRNVKALFLKDLKILLWSLLLIVPGIMKAYSYALVPYILAEDPDITAADALAKSEAMMAGHRKEAFVLDLSFILWYLLGVVTLGIGYVLYVGPYTTATDAEFYKAVKELAE